MPSILRFRHFLNADDLDQFRGIRLEDVNNITADGCENDTICPRTIQEIESVKAGGKVASSSWYCTRTEADKTN